MVSHDKYHMVVIGHFRVHLSLHFKARLSAKSLLWKSVSFIFKLELIIITKDSHLDSLWKRDWGTRKWPIGIFASPTLIHCFCRILFPRVPSVILSPVVKWKECESLWSFQSRLMWKDWVLHLKLQRCLMLRGKLSIESEARAASVRFHQSHVHWMKHLVRLYSNKLRLQ